MSLTAWKTLAPTPKMGRRDEPTSIEVESDNEGGSPFPAQCTFDIVEEFAPVQHIHHRRTSTIAARAPRPRMPRFLLALWPCRFHRKPMLSLRLAPTRGPLDDHQVPESEFKHVLEYTERQRFKFKLSRWQCRDLVETMCSYDAKLRTKRLFEELHLS